MAHPSLQAKRPTRPIVLACWVALAAMVAYWPVVLDGYTYDDSGVIVGNPVMDHLLYPSTYFEPQYFAVSDESTYRPLVSFSYGVEYALWGKSPVGDHAVNLLLHVLASVMLVPVCFSLGASRRVALAAGLLYAVHPLRSEAVCSLGFREDLLCTMFYLAALALWPPFAWHASAVAAREKGGRKGPAPQIPEPSVALSWPGPAGRMALAFGAFALGLLSKEMTLSFPLVALAKDLRGWRRGTPRTGDFLKRRLPWHIVAWLMTAGALFVFLTFHDTRASFDRPDSVLLWRRVAGFFWIAVRYLGLFVFPHPLRVDYAVDLAGPWLVPSGAAGAAGLAILGIFAFRKRAAFPAGWYAFVAFLCMLGPVSNLIRLDHPMAERYLTLPLAALCYVAAHLWARWRATTGRRVLLGAVLIVCVAHSWLRCREWQSQYTLWGAEIARGTRSGVAYNNYAAALMDMDRYDDAIANLREALRLLPDDPEALGNLGYSYNKLGQYGEAEKYLRQAIALQPNAGSYHAHLAEVLTKTNQPQEAAEERKQALRLGRYDANVCNSVGLQLLIMGDEVGAEEEFRAAVGINPRLAEAQSNLGRLLVQHKRYAEAIPYYYTALNLKPNLPEAFEGLGVAFEGLNRLPEAADAFARLATVQPRLARAYWRLGQVLLRAGRRDDARRWLEQGLSVARQGGDTAMEGAIRQALAAAQ